MKLKKRLTQTEEFEILKLVLDKFLWLGFGIMALGLYWIYTASLEKGIYLIITGAIVLLIFMVIIVKEYEMIK